MNNLSDRELDARVAEKVMGWRTHKLSEEVWYQPEAHNSAFKKSWQPSTDISCAMEIVEKMRERLDFEILVRRDHYIVNVGQEIDGVWKYTDKTTENESLPRAICEAALSAMESDAR